MIIIGYQGIGKSTLSLKDINIIDLESGNFWYQITDVSSSRIRDDMWYKPYCSIANHLSKQGYDVCVSSHECVRLELLRGGYDEHVVAVVPSLELESAWIQKLEDRYLLTHSDKDKKALLNAKDRYQNNILEIKYDCDNIIEITNMNYDLGLLIHEYHKQHNVR